jgi:DNA primase
VVATSGTAITVDQLKILNRYGSEIAFSFDSDNAGDTAMKRAVTLSLQNDISTKIIFLPGPFKDPDEAIKSDPKNWQRAVEKAKPALEYWIDLLIKKSPDLGVTAKKAIAKEILPVIKTIYSDIEKEYYIKYLAGKLSVSEKALIAALEKTKSENKKKEESKGEKISKLSIEEKILGFIWHDPKLIKYIKNEFTAVTNPELTEFMKMINNKEINKEKLDPKEASILNQYEMLTMDELETSDQESVKAELIFLISRFRSENTDHLKADFAQRIQVAESKGDKEKVKLLLQEFSNLIK